MKDGFIKVRCFSPDITVGDTEHNSEQIIKAICDSADLGVKILVLPELCVTAYTCADLFSQEALINASEKSLEKIRNATLGKEILVFVGAPLIKNNRLYNCAVVFCNGDILGIVPKMNLPNYSEFYELRYFSEPDLDEETITVNGKEYPFGNDILFECRDLKNFTVGCEICEDLWVKTTPSETLCNMGATVICNLSASNEIVCKDSYRRLLCTSKSASLFCAYLYSDASETESTTDLVFGAHNIVCENGTILKESKPFESKNGDVVTEIDINKLINLRAKVNTFDVKNPPLARKIYFDMTVSDTVLTRKFGKLPFVPSDKNEVGQRCEQILTMQSRALAKRLTASHSKCAVIGISGGLDSTLALLVCVRAADYLGWQRDKIVALTMPCFGTTVRTKNNATELCKSLKVSLKEIDIFNSVRSHFRDIKHSEQDHNVTFENAQARERTQVLMDVANDLGGIVVGTGDLSEIALGWSTYNADHMSMYNVNCTVPKTLVRHLVAYYAANTDKQTELILNDILNTPVSPELLPPSGNDIAQKTEDLIGPYELHDFFLYYMIRMSFTPSKIFRLAKEAFNGEYDGKTVYKWLEVFIKRFFAQQFKRSCSPDGVKVGSVALSPRGDLKMPSDASPAIWLSDLEKVKPM